MKKINDYFIGDLHPSLLFILTNFAFAVVGIGFALTNALQYAFASFIIAFTISKFLYQLGASFQTSDAVLSFGMELDFLTRFTSYGLLPGVIAVIVSQVSIWGLLVAFIYIFSVGIRLAHFNRDQQYIPQLPPDKVAGLDLELSAPILALSGLLYYVLPLVAFQVIFLLLMFLAAIGHILHIPIDKMPFNMDLILSGLMMVVAIIFIWIGGVF